MLLTYIIIFRSTYSKSSELHSLDMESHPQHEYCYLDPWNKLSFWQAVEALKRDRESHRKLTYSINPPTGWGIAEKQLMLICIS